MGACFSKRTDTHCGRCVVVVNGRVIVEPLLESVRDSVPRAQGQATGIEEEQTRSRFRVSLNRPGLLDAMSTKLIPVDLEEEEAGSGGGVSAPAVRGGVMDNVEFVEDDDGDWPAQAPHSGRKHH
eukprot:jgi/Mesvir1/22216/Mv03848-RA.1